MFEKVNPSHPDKVADRIAGALVDLAYSRQKDPKIAAEVLIGHARCLVIVESSVPFSEEDVDRIVERIAGPYIATELIAVAQDEHLAENQSEGFRCGDNGIFKGMPTTIEQDDLSGIVRTIYADFPTDGKYILDIERDRLIICQSNATHEQIARMYPRAEINPLGDWTGGTDVDTGATNRKLGSDMGDAVTGGGLHGKDLSKADVSVNIYAHLKANRTGKPVEMVCAIGDTEIDGVPFSEIVAVARDYIRRRGGFERFAEWGLI